MKAFLRCMPLLPCTKKWWQIHLAFLTQVTEGSGTIMVLAVGPNSEWGKTMALVQTEAVDTPLQGNLTQLAAAIGKIGLFAGVLCFVALMIRYQHMKQCLCSGCRGLSDAGLAQERCTLLMLYRPLALS